MLGRNLGLFESADVLVSNALESPEHSSCYVRWQTKERLVKTYRSTRCVDCCKSKPSWVYLHDLTKQVTPFDNLSLVPLSALWKRPMDWVTTTGRWSVLGRESKVWCCTTKAGIDIDNVSPAVQDALVASGLAQRSGSIAGTEFGDLFAIDLVKQTMPTYSMVPEAIKALRRIPVVGNFMAFPAEIIRTTGNIVNRAVKEMGFKATDDLIESLRSVRDDMTPEQVAADLELATRKAEALARQIRGIGAQRLTGYIAMAQVAPIAMRDAAHTT